MENINISQLYNNETIKDISSIEVQLGKQKKKKYQNTSFYFSTEGFVPLEKTIWNNFREYNSHSTLKIRTEEWEKIIRGFKKLSVLLKSTEYNDETTDLLGFKSNGKHEDYKKNFASINKDIDIMLTGFIDWIEPELPNHSHITITV